MSFKRDGDDKEALAALKKRRVVDLLGEEVPPDEVSKLSNGRLTCLVCNHRPIFDTLSVLYVHRQGKRHLASAAYQDQQQLELRALVDKRAHEQFVKSGSATVQQAQPVTSARSGLGLGAPYDPRVKKRKPFDRKSRLDLHGTETQSTAEPSPGNSALAPVATVSKWLPGNKRKPDHHDNKNKIKIDITAGGNDSEAKSAGHFDYLKKDFTRRKPVLNYVNDSGPDINHSNMNKVIMGSENISKYYLARRKQSQQTYTTNNSRNDNIDSSNYSSAGDNISNGPSTGLHNTWNKFKSAKKTFSSAPVNVPVQGKECDQMTSLPSDKPVKLKTGLSEQSDRLASNKTATCTSSPTEPDVERARKLRLLAGSGWKKDWDGRWVRDEDAEFDSDEEPPDIT